MAEPFIVSARKYRPQRFDDVIGQPQVSHTLKNAIRNQQLAQAFLFCGPRGVGKTTSARILAKVINCDNMTADIEACDTCPSCQAFNNNQSMSVYELDAASNNSVDDIRALTEQVRFSPPPGKKKIYIIDEVHMLSAAAFNAFLKTLEEPPPYALFILATTEKHKIIPTILSRCQIFDFNRIKVDDMVQHLKQIALRENIQAEDDALHVIAVKADGALRDALSMFDRISIFGNGVISYSDTIKNLNILDYDYFFQFTEALQEGDSSKALLLYDDVLQKGFEGDVYLNGFADHLRQLLVTRDPGTEQLLDTTDNLRQRYKTQAVSTPLSFIINGLAVVSEAEATYKTARNKRLSVELALVKMAFAGTFVKSGGGTLLQKKN